MIIAKDYSIEKSEKYKYPIVVSHNKPFCPCCGNEIIYFGKKLRKYDDNSGKRKKIYINRCYCKKCNKIHHELIDILVPYKLKTSDVIEQCVDAKDPYEITSCDSSTVYRIKRWFRNIKQDLTNRLISCLKQYPAIEESEIPSLQDNHRQKGWLKKTVLVLVNFFNWPPTHFASSLKKGGDILQTMTPQRARRAENGPQGMGEDGAREGESHNSSYTGGLVEVGFSPT